MDINLKESTNVFFLNIDIGRKLTGIEVSAFNRSYLFSSKLGIDPKIVTIYYKPDLHFNIYKHKKEGKIIGDISVINMYDFFQEAIDLPYNPDVSTPFFANPENLIIAPVPENNHHFRVYQDGHVTAYIVNDSEYLGLSYVNHICEGKIWMREWYDCRGFLSKIQLIEPGTLDPRAEYFLRPDGTLAISRLYEWDSDKKNRWHKVTKLHDKKGIVSIQFSDEKDMVYYFLKRLVKRDDVLLIDRISEFFYPAKQIKIEKGIKIACIYHSLHVINKKDKAGDPFSSPLNSYQKPSLENFGFPDAHITLTEKQKNDMAIRFGYKEKIYCIPHFYFPHQQNYEENRDLNKIIFVGRLEEEKQPQLALEAFYRASKKIKSIYLEFYGYGSMKEDLTKKVQEYGIEKRVLIYDFSSSIDKVYKKAGLLLSTSRDEGFSLVILEALSHGCPVIAFDCPYGPSQIIQNGLNGFLVEPQNVNALASKLEEVFLNKNIHKKLLDSARESINIFEIDRIAELWKEMLTRISNET